MQQSEAIFLAFRQGLSMEHLAAILAEPTVKVEEVIRQSLNGNQPELGPAKDGAEETTRHKRNGAASSSERPPRAEHVAAMRRSPARRAAAAAVEDFSDYPVALRDPRAVTQRAVYDAIKAKPLTVPELATLLGQNSDAIFQALAKMRGKNLVHGAEGLGPVLWGLA